MRREMTFTTDSHTITIQESESSWRNDVVGTRRASMKAAMTRLDECGVSRIF